MTPEQQAQEWAKSRYWDVDSVGKGCIEMDQKCGAEDWLAGHAAGKQEERERIWKAIAETKKEFYGLTGIDRDLTMSEIKRIIFGDK